jgi:hypothetical protein
MRTVCLRDIKSKFQYNLLQLHLYASGSPHMERSGALSGLGIEKFMRALLKKPREGLVTSARKRWTKELRAQEAAVGAAGHTRLYLRKVLHKYTGGGGQTPIDAHGLEVEAGACLEEINKTCDAAGVGDSELAEQGGEREGRGHGIAGRRCEHCHHTGL